MSLCIIATWFGKLPGYFNLWLKSAGLNQQIQFLVFTDHVYMGYVPDNVNIVRTQLARLEELASDKLDTPVRLKHPYKLCDLRPAYGLVFSEYLQGCTHWGHCDLDMVWGDLGRFITPQMLEEHDRVLVHGHLSIYRNDDMANRYFMLDTPGIDWRHILQCGWPHNFDEECGMSSICRRHGIREYRSTCMADIRTKHYKFLICHRENYAHQAFCWSNGRVLRYYENGDGAIECDEHAYIHFQKRGPIPVLGDLESCLAVWITPYGFVCADFPDLVDTTFLDVMNPAHSMAHSWAWHKRCLTTMWQNQLFKLQHRR
ncbi:MAG: DUF6625 family protein [Armatimonadota bacterium]